MPNPTMIAMQDEEDGFIYTVEGPYKKIRGGGDVNQEFYYLAGPMTNLPKFNFPAFDAASAKLRDSGYNVVSPAELDAEQERAKAMRSRKGKHEVQLHRECLRRDLRDYILNYNLVGVICLDGWQNSVGAQWETGLAEFLGIPLYRYADEGDSFALIEFDRSEAMMEGGWE